jgi:succinate dehydrogenase/fumarate reductase cytochrome b subunit
MSIDTFLHKVNDLILNPIIALLFALSFVYFIYGIIRFLASDAGDKGGQRAEARNSIIWGIVGMVIMFSVFGIIKFVMTTFGISSSDIGDAKNYLPLP